MHEFLFFQYSLIYLEKYLKQFKNKNINDIPDDFEEDLVLVFSYFDVFSNIEKNLIYFEKEKLEFNDFNNFNVLYHSTKYIEDENFNNKIKSLMFEFYKYDFPQSSDLYFVYRKKITKSVLIKLLKLFKIKTTETKVLKRKKI